MTHKHVPVTSPGVFIKEQSHVCVLLDTTSPGYGHCSVGLRRVWGKT